MEIVSNRIAAATGGGGSFGSSTSTASGGSERSLRRWNASTNRGSHARRESLTGGTLMSLKAYYRKLRTFKGTVKALINLRRVPTVGPRSPLSTRLTKHDEESESRTASLSIPKVADAVVKLADDESSLQIVQSQVKDLVEKGHVITELDPRAKDDVTYRLQGNLEHYTEENLRKRIKLQEHPHMVALTQRLWLSATQDRNEPLTYGEYEAYMLRLHRLILPEFEITQSKELIKDDWTRDTDGGDRLDYRFFHFSMFELVDLWTDTVDIEDYISLLYCIMHCLTFPWNNRHVLKALEDIELVDILEASKEVTMDEIERDLSKEVNSSKAADFLNQIRGDEDFPGGDAEIAGVNNSNGVGVQDTDPADTYLDDSVVLESRQRGQQRRIGSDPVANLREGASVSQKSDTSNMGLDALVKPGTGHVLQIVQSDTRKVTSTANTSLGGINKDREMRSPSKPSSASHGDKSPRKPTQPGLSHRPSNLGQGQSSVHLVSNAIISQSGSQPGEEVMNGVPTSPRLDSDGANANKSSEYGAQDVLGRSSDRPSPSVDGPFLHDQQQFNHASSNDLTGLNVSGRQSHPSNGTRGSQPAVISHLEGIETESGSSDSADSQSALSIMSLGSGGSTIGALSSKSRFLTRPSTTNMHSGSNQDDQSVMLIKSVAMQDDSSRDHTRASSPRHEYEHSARRYTPRYLTSTPRSPSRLTSQQKESEQRPGLLTSSSDQGHAPIAAGHADEQTSPRLRSGLLRPRPSTQSDPLSIQGIRGNGKGPPITIPDSGDVYLSIGNTGEIGHGLSVVSLGGKARPQFNGSFRLSGRPSTSASPTRTSRADLDVGIDGRPLSHGLADSNASPPNGRNATNSGRIQHQPLWSSRVDTDDLSIAPLAIGISSLGATNRPPRANGRREGATSSLHNPPLNSRTSDADAGLFSIGRLLPANHNAGDHGRITTIRRPTTIQRTGKLYGGFARAHGSPTRTGGAPLHASRLEIQSLSMTANKKTPSIAPQKS